MSEQTRLSIRAISLWIAFIVVLAGCGGGDSESAPSDAETEPTTQNEEAQDTSGSGDYSVVMVASVDNITAEGQLVELEAAGFEGFVKEPSAGNGFDVYRPGLSEDEAEALLEDIRSTLSPGAAGSSTQRGVVWETGSWRQEDEGASSSDEATTASNHATITVGETIYQFDIDLPNQCGTVGPVMFGTLAIDAAGNAVQGGNANQAVALHFSIPPTDWEAQGLQPPQIAVDDTTTGIRWQAGGLDTSSGVDPADSEVVSWTITNGRAEGTATFIDLNAHFAGQETEPTPGSFEIVCSG